MSTLPRVTERWANYVEMVFRNNPDVNSWVVGAANNLDVAYAGVTTMFSIARGSTYQSRTIRQKRIGRTQYENRGLARAFYDPEDYWVAGGTLPHDYETTYLRVSEVGPTGIVRPAGPILIVPSKDFYYNTRPKLTIVGTAPDVSGSTNRNPPPDSMHFVLPRYADSCTCMNRGDTNSLYISFAAGEPELEIPKGETVYLNEAVISDVYVRGNTAFQLYVALVNAEMA